jgi:hypothetical protein
MSWGLGFGLDILHKIITKFKSFARSDTQHTIAEPEELRPVCTARSVICSSIRSFNVGRGTNHSSKSTSMLTYSTLLPIVNNLRTLVKSAAKIGSPQSVWDGPPPVCCRDRREIGLNWQCKNKNKMLNTVGLEPTRNYPLADSYLKLAP